MRLWNYSVDCYFAYPPTFDKRTKKMKTIRVFVDRILLTPTLDSLFYKTVKAEKWTKRKQGKDYLFTQSQQKYKEKPWWDTSEQSLSPWKQLSQTGDKAEVIADLIRKLGDKTLAEAVFQEFLQATPTKRAA